MEWRRIRWLRLLGVLLAAFLLFCPTLILLAWGGWLRIIGVAALLAGAGGLGAGGLAGLAARGR